MNFDQAELQDAARQVLGGLGTPADADQTWQQVVELGWLLMSVPEDLGGLGQGLSAACALYAELGRGLATPQYLSSMLAIDAVCHGGIAHRDAWIERLTSGEYVAVPLVESALSVAGDGSGGMQLTGLASAVPSADKASHILVRTTDDSHIALVKLAQPGVELTYRPTWDATRRLFDVRFRDLELEAGLIVASGPAAAELGKRLSTHRDFALAADSVGGATALLDMTVEYLQTRRQFGRPLAMFQALKHRSADLKVHVAAAEALLLDNLARLDDRSFPRLRQGSHSHPGSSPGQALTSPIEGEGWVGVMPAQVGQETLHDGGAEAEILAKKAKHLACSVYSEVAEEAVQLHGGIGMTSEYPCHLYLKRALLNETLGGGNDERDIAAWLLNRLCP